MYLNRTEESGGVTENSEDSQEERAEGRGIDLIINATPVGMYPKIADIPIPPGLLDKHQTVFDLVYNPVETKL